MRHSPFRRVVGALLVGLMAVTIPGCDKDPVNGKIYHQDSFGTVTIEFNKGKAKMEMMGEAKTLDYKVEGDKITILDKGGDNIELTHHSDDTLTGPMPIGTLRPSK